MPASSRCSGSIEVRISRPVHGARRLRHAAREHALLVITGRELGLGERTLREEAQREDGHHEREQDGLLARHEVGERLVRRLDLAEQQPLREPQHVERAEHDAGHGAHREHERQASCRPGTAATRR